MKKRRSWIALLVAAAVMLNLGACGKKEEPKEKKEVAAKSAKSGAPKIVAVGDKFQFGKVKQGASVEHVFKVRNEGNAVLKITKAKGS